MLSVKAEEGDSWILGEHGLVVLDRETHRGITRACRPSCRLMSTGVNPEKSYVIYKFYVIPRMLYVHVI